MSDADQHASLWLEEARRGSPEALGRLLEHYRQYLLLVANRKLDPALRVKGGASDLVQETFLEAQRDFPQFTGASELELRAWLRRLLLNNVGTFARSYRGTAKRAIGREVELSPDQSEARPVDRVAAAEPTPSRLAIAAEAAEAIKRAVACLPDDYRQVILLRYEQEQSFEDVGRIMGRSPEAVRKLWVRAIERLRREWDAEG
jgi:RNA polymerase sigma-70 factor (ECF subfamily)